MRILSILIVLCLLAAPAAPAEDCVKTTVAAAVFGIGRCLDKPAAQCAVCITTAWIPLCMKMVQEVCGTSAEEARFECYLDPADACR